MRTYQTLYKNEIRAVEITINDQDGQPFLSDNAYTTIKDSNNTVVVAEQAAYTTENKVYTIVGTVTTGTIGKYKIIGKLIKDDYIYYLTTELQIKDV